ncbi:30S ribosomal chloroplastic [Micractinium conductrix]|uniref:30S ribosomal chloroplastic n=1 Tax=Micractinium conductrix TaxID=554055 RepID=A0A2P6VMD1_9CHLO|nr:30S ribosomal chloroplastic [Micractinium conductrix]|eukprot:PSC75243.1 30S ribosomal chloroplastic [Micractinium conductrix]
MQAALSRAVQARPFTAAAVPRSQPRRQLRAAVAAPALEEPAAEATAEVPELSSEELYARFESMIAEHDMAHSVGDRVQGTVVRVDQRGAYVDIGGKSTAFCPTAELALANIPKSAAVVGPHTVREFMVIREERSGDLTLSLKRLEMAVAWQRLRQFTEDDVAVTGEVVGTNRGGVIVEVENIRGFCPGSQLGQRVATFEELLGRVMPFKVTEVDEEKARLMLSNKRIAADERTAGFKVGDVVEGTVMSVKPYGAFVEIGGASGLLHISQISHDRITNVEKVLSEGDRIKVMVLSQDRERGRVALCTKKLEPTPGDMLRDPALVYEKAEEMAALFRARVAAAEAAARGQGDANVSSEDIAAAEAAAR